MTVTHSIRRRINAYTHRAGRIQKRINLLAALRLVTFVAGVLGLYLYLEQGWIYLGASLTLAALVGFLYLMVVQDRCYRFKKKCNQLLALLENDLACTEYRFRDVVRENSIRFEAHHPFAHDLDLGEGSSILAALDNCFHHNGTRLLRQWMERADAPAQIRARQEAVRDLSDRKRFRLRLSLTMALDSHAELDSGDPGAWLRSPSPWTIRPWAYWPGRLLSLLTISSLVLNFFFQVTLLPWLPFLIAQVLVFYAMDFAHRRYLLAFMERGSAFAATCAIIGTFEKVKVRAPLLQGLRGRLMVDGKSAGPALRRLLYFQDMLAYRESGFAHFLLNALFLWDQHYLRRLNHWRGQHGAHLQGWIEAIFELEALSSLANFRWLFPGRPFPELVAGHDFIIQGRDLGHPALPEDRRIGNDYELLECGKVHLVTGSNMSGKSTFLRTIGINLVLARMGATVCARSLRCSLPEIWSSIRIQDSLAEGISYFYAEVQRLKQILEAVGSNPRPTLYLLDEILKGTNSRERLIACKALVRFLMHHRASGLITTHDLEMLELQKQHPQNMANFHFQERFLDEEMHFDYKLKPGELTSTNALRLMKFAGLPLDFED